MSDETRFVASAPIGIADAIDRWVYGCTRYWLTVLVGVGALATLLPVIAPVLRATGNGWLSAPIYAAYQVACHQRDDRSFHILGASMAFCERDLAIYLSMVLAASGFAVVRRRATIRPLSLFWLIVCSFPMALDGGTQLGGLREGSWQLRLLTGSLFGGGVAWCMLPRLDMVMTTIARDITSRRRVTV